MAGRKNRTKRQSRPSAADRNIGVDNAYRDLAVRVRERRRELELSQRALADRMLTSERSIRRIEKAAHNVTIRVLVHLAQALDVGLHNLLAPVPKQPAGADDPAADGRSANGRRSPRRAPPSE